MSLLACVVSVIVFSTSAFARQSTKTISSDSAVTATPKSTVHDSLNIKSFSSATKDSTAKKGKNSTTVLTSPVHYSAKDSIVMYKTGNAYMYGESNVKYEDMELSANYIHLNADSSMVDARGLLDADSILQGTPVFKEKGEEYQTKTIEYNFKTKKGFVRQAVMQQGDGYVIGKETKKVGDDIFYMKNGHYTTCDNHEHPHFYLNLTKAKVKQKHWVTTGPAYLVMMDVPLPLIIPFGYFPFTSSYSSGVIVPSYGDEMTRGFYLKEGGYYFALSDYFDLALVGDIYTKGSWAVNATSRYVKRYKFNGNVSLSYRNDKYGEKEVPGYTENRNFAITWSHTQNPKSMPNSTFSASVSFTTSGYDRSNVDNYYNPSQLTQNTKSSSISYSHSFPNTPFSISASILANQRTSDSTVSLTLPDVTFTMNRIYPFKRKNKVGKDRWYEKIYLSYNANFANSIETKEDKVFHSSLITDWKNGVNHTIPIGASFNLFKYISVTPSANYHSRWYMQHINQSWDYTTNELLLDTVAGFSRVFDFNVGISASTKLYGFYKPMKIFGGKKISAIRHVFTPTVSFSYHPDFSTGFWGYYSSYTRPNADSVTTSNVTYSPYAYGQYGVPGQGMSGALTFSINNNVEMKLRQTNDTTGEDTYKKISLIDALSLSTSYNMAADSLKWSNISANLRLKFTKSLSFNINGTFDQYKLGFNKYNSLVHINKLRWDNGLPRLINASTSFSYTFSNDMFKRHADDKNDFTRLRSQRKSKGAGLTEADVDEEMQTANAEAKRKEDEGKQKETDADGYQKFSMPWTLSFDYSMRYGNTSEVDSVAMEYKRELTHNLGVRGTLQLTSKWNLSLGLSYDFNNHEITYSTMSVTRNLHCWSMSANIVPFGLYKSYNFTVQVSSELLSDLKYEQRSDYSYSNNWY